MLFGPVVWLNEKQNHHPHRLQAYRDSVNEVRVGASEGLQRLCKVCGADWLQEKLLPRIHGFYDESTFYLIRIAILNAFKKLANDEVGLGDL